MSRKHRANSTTGSAIPSSSPPTSSPSDGKKSPRRSDFFWRIVISLVGIALILMAVGNLMLFFFGEPVTGSFSVRRYGGERQGVGNDQRYTWYVDYTFTTKDGKTYDGHLTKLGSALSVKHSSTIRYFPPAPFLNTTEDTAEPNLGQLAMVAAGGFLLYAMNRPAARLRRRKRARKAGSGH